MRNVARSIIKSTTRSGFTIVELLVTISVLVVVLGITVLYYSSQQVLTRDSVRNTQTTVLAEALEQYYEQNNEYPSVASLANRDVSAVKTKLGLIDESVLKFPGSESVTFPIVSNATGPSTQRLVYTGVPSGAQCQTQVDGYCESFRLTYLSEADGTAVNVDSRQKPFVAPSSPCSGAGCIAAPSQPSIAGQDINSQANIRFTASGATCAEGTLEYKIRYNTATASESSMPNWDLASWQTSTTVQISRGSDVNFYSQAQARCVNGSDYSVAVSSSIHTLTVVVGTPCTPLGSYTLSTGSVSSSSVNISWTTPSGTSPISYQVYYGTTSNPTTLFSNTSANSATVSGLNSSTTYYFRVTATNDCPSSSNSSVENATTNAVPCGTALGSFSITGQSSTTNSISVSWGAPTGTTPIQYEVFYSTSSSSQTTSAGTTTSTSRTISGLSGNTTYYIRIQASNNCGSRSTAAISQATQNPGVAPSEPTLSFTALSAVSLRLSWTSSTGTAPISYSVSGPNISGCTTSPCTITGLQPNTWYSYSVTASNSFGSATGTGQGLTMNTALVVSSASTRINGSNFISWSWTNGYSHPSGSTYSFIAGAGSCSGGLSTTGCSNYDRSNCAVATTIRVSNNVASRHGDTTTDTVSVPANGPFGITILDRYRNGVRYTWNEQNVSTYYPQRIVHTDSITTDYSVESVQPPTLVSGALRANSGYQIRIYGANCAGRSNSYNAVNFNTLAN